MTRSPHPPQGAELSRPATRVRTTDDARRALGAAKLDIALTVATFDTALRRLAEHVGGYPASASGADSGGGGQRTITVDGDAVPVSAVEAAAFAGRRDQALSDRQAAFELVGALHDAARDLARIVARYGAGQVSSRDVLSAVDIWCRNDCGGRHVAPRAAGSQHCRWCGGFQREYGQLPPAELVDRHDTGHRIYPADVHRALERAAKRPAKGKKRAA